MTAADQKELDRVIAADEASLKGLFADFLKEQEEARKHKATPGTAKWAGMEFHRDVPTGLDPSRIVKAFLNSEENA